MELLHSSQLYIIEVSTLIDVSPKIYNDTMGHKWEQKKNRELLQYNNVNNLVLKEFDKNLRSNWDLGKLDTLLSVKHDFFFGG